MQSSITRIFRRRRYSRPAATDLVRADVRLLAKNIGYVMGAGDEVPDSLRQIGATVTCFRPKTWPAPISAASTRLSPACAPITHGGICARTSSGCSNIFGTAGPMVVQYNTAEGGGPGGPLRGAGGRGGGAAADAAAVGVVGGQRWCGPPRSANIGPYPLTVGRDRVTVEDAPVKFLDPANPLLHQPNEITERDFQGWVQERGCISLRNGISRMRNSLRPMTLERNPVGQYLIHAVWQRRLYFHGVFVLPGASRRSARGVSPVREFPERRPA